MKLNNKYGISSGKNATFQAPNSTVDLETWSGILDTDTNLNGIKKMGSKVIKSHQCLLERSHALSMKVNSEF